jgi:hypothetical protein
LQYFNDRENAAASLIVDIHLDGNDVKFHGITIALGIIPIRQGIEAVVDHANRVAQIFPAILASRQIRKVGRDAGIARRAIIFVEPDALDRKFKIACIHDFMSWFVV